VPSHIRWIAAEDDSAAIHHVGTVRDTQDLADVLLDE
jgi:hypothetical protein